MEDRNIKMESQTNEVVDTLGLDDEDDNSEIRTVGYDAYLKAQGIMLDPSNEFETMVGL